MLQSLLRFSTMLSSTHLYFNLTYNTLSQLNIYSVLNSNLLCFTQCLVLSALFATANRLLCSQSTFYTPQFDACITKYVVLCLMLFLRSYGCEQWRHCKIYVTKHLLVRRSNIITVLRTTMNVFALF